MSENVLYAGYGSNRDPAMIEAITGEEANLVGRIAILGMELCEQRMSQAPNRHVIEGAPSAREILIGNYGPNALTHIGRQHKLKSIDANLYRLSPMGYELLRAWELIDFQWKEHTEVGVQLRSDNSVVSAVTEVLPRRLFIPSRLRIARISSGYVYPTYINNNPAVMQRIATEAHEEYLRDNQS